MKWSIRSAALLLLLVAVAAPLAAQVTFGVATSGNNYPFGKYDVTPPNVYQQVYGSSGFNSPFTITSIQFYPRPGYAAYGFSPGNYTIGFSTTSLAVDGLTTDPATNLGPDAQTFFSGFLSGGFTVAGTPFSYNPSLGNLLMTVVVESQTGSMDNYFGTDVTVGDEMSRFSYYNWGVEAYAYTDSYGLVTTFNGEAGATVPEPTSLLLIGTGLAALARGIRRRKSA